MTWNPRPHRRLALAGVTASLLGVTLAASSSTAQTPQTPPRSAQERPSHAGPKPTVVLVHGVWADGSSWSAVTDRLLQAGYPVDVEANPLRGVATDAQYLRDLLATISGPIVLVSHSYGGMVATNAATGNPNIKALVYVDAYLPDRGDSVYSLTSAEPGSQLDPATSFNQVELHNAQGDVIGADLYVKQALFPAIFAGGVASRTASRLAAGQRPLTFSALTEASPGVPAWKTIPSWDLVGTADKVIPPAEQLIMAQRAGAHIVKVNAPHLSMVSNPGAVTKLIEAAANCS